MSDAAGRRQERAEERFREDLRAAVAGFLDFAPEHAALAEEITQEAVERAPVPGPRRSGRGRGPRPALAERAELAARSVIRHRHTGYEADLDALAGSGFSGDEALYQQARQVADRAVDDFLRRHRR